MCILLRKLYRFATEPNFRFSYLFALGFYNHMDDEKYLKKKWKLYMGYPLDIKYPRTFNEKLQWLKLYAHRPEYTTMVDKYAVKQYVADKIGKEYIIPTYGVWDRFEDINFDTLPKQFILKCTHDSGGLVIVKDKKNMDIKAAKKKIETSLKRNYYYAGREWPYKNVKPRIIAEKYMVDEVEGELKDYKVFNFNGCPRFIQVDYNRFSGHKRNLYTTDWEYIPASIQYPTDPDKYIPKPEKLNDMIELAKMLSKDIPHLRTDFYIVNNHIYFGELTFYHGCGFEKFDPPSMDLEWGNYIELPPSNEE